MTNALNNVPRELMDSLLTVIESNGYAAAEVEVVDELRALLSAPSPAGVDGLDVVGWYTEDHLDDKSATTYSWTVAERWVEKGWPVSPLYAAPVSEAKAQGVVLDGSQLAGLLEQVRLDDDEAKPHGIGAAYWNNSVIACQVAIRDALAAPVQQVSVPGGWRVERGYSPSGYVLHSPSGSMVRVCDSGGGGIETAFALFLKAMLAAAPAAPAADAGHVFYGMDGNHP